jgi:diguanylate cyclase (GGDEF)-like protein
VSVGAAELTAGRYPDHALFRADRALHVAKARGGDTIVLDGPEVQDWARDRSALMSWLHQLRTENDALRHQTLTDPLTGLPNLRALRQAEALLAGADYPVGVIFADLDRFSEYNHHYGDTAGDHALTTVAAQLVAGLRDGDQVFRKGGEEFVALLPGATPEVTEMAAERLRAAVHDLGLPHAVNPPTGRLTITAAVVTTSPGTSPEHARATAADLVYAAKLANARNQVHHP